MSEDCLNIGKCILPGDRAAGIMPDANSHHELKVTAPIALGFLLKCCYKFVAISLKKSYCL